MTVRELIEQLQRFDLDDKVGVDTRVPGPDPDWRTVEIIGVCHDNSDRIRCLLQPAETIQAKP